ncbi:elongator complex protein 6 [Rutidosis leptorrhynchoides]|uniref:elongator complex protein 6 n=1 Tax=Rutidosis leptorrhynchoides TaxID=125765 RepID=UPI003A99909B
MDRPATLLDEALNLDNGESISHQKRTGRVVLVEDCVETSGAFVLHHLLKRFLSTNLSSSDNIVIFLAFAQPFSHYDRILRKMGCNLVVQRENKRLTFFDMLMLECPDDGVEGGLIALFGNIQKAVEVNSLNKNVNIIIDDISLLEVAAKGSTRDVLNFMHYCHTLTTQFGCTIVIVVHEDIYASGEESTLPLPMAYLADIMIKASPLMTGLASDVHGQLTVLNKGGTGELGSSKSKTRNFHYRIKDNSVDYFYPGSRS